MILLDSHVLGFGKLRDYTLDFKEGMNLVFAANEGGKSTLQGFLIGMLYGQLRSDLKMQKRLDPWVEGYKPWYGLEYGGKLHCRLADGRDLEIRRSFGKDENRIEIRTLTGEDIVRQYQQQRNGEVLFAKHHFGMPKELFESVSIIRENRASEIRNRETIRDRIANLAHSGDEDLSIRQSMSRLEAMLDAVGSDRAPTKPFKQTMDLVRDLQEERNAIYEQRSRFQEWLLERNRIAGEVRQLHAELSAARISLAAARSRDIAARIESLEDIDRGIAALREATDALGFSEDFPVDRLEELNQRVGARDSIARRLESARTGKKTSLLQLAQAEAERQELSAYASLLESEESEKITEWFVNYLSLLLQKDGLKNTSDRLRGEAEALEKRLNKLCASLRNPGTNWQGFVREATQEEQDASRKGTTLAENLAQEKSNLAVAVRTAFNRRLSAVAFIFLAAAPTALRHLSGFEGFPEAFQYGFGAGCLALSVWMWIVAAKISRNGREAEKKARGLELEHERILEEGTLKRKKLEEVIKTSGFRGVDDFISAAIRSEQDRLKLEDLVARREEVELQGLQYQEKAEELYRMLKDRLAKVGLSCSPGNLKFQVDFLRTNLRRFRERDTNYRRCLQKADSLKSEETALEGEYGIKRSQIQALLDEAGVDTPERFRSECLKRQKSVELLEKLASRTREFNRLVEGRTLEQWKETLLDMEAQQEIQVEGEDGPERKPDGDREPDLPLLPYMPTIAELEEKERQLVSRLSDARQDHARSVERVSHAFRNHRSASEIDEDLAVAEAKFRELEINRAALGIAIDTIEKMSRQQQEVLAPQLNAAVEGRFVRLCGERYSEVKIDPDFNVWVRETDTGELRSAEHLSRGTQDQLYLAIRFGILDLVSNEEEPCPCLLDEPFAAYDNPRLLEAFNILVEESTRRQLILFTCREDMLDIAQQRDANIVRLK